MSDLATDMVADSKKLKVPMSGCMRQDCFSSDGTTHVNGHHLCYRAALAKNILKTST